ncbi:LPS-assembly lipoprotein RlpB precursor (Rare lipoprotein B) [Thioalkalivibrio nitratireducens DSM 14787]|uniref:LPS-assembly lipoprotein LptE n=1 Tax=Thioalkalivibrio nitratireducens (strain DSM 14787 / UNIQEM 213 / ALEN2) TaxID=1255043 RepID=L0E0J7_THIND|nr:LPS assembly lipoprotein LptE [Thioalkalivibrio nitratireducens]AGA34166.1 LPS-assembly lipoprotein RlpB precursor (Rare lipoprotein B) [Thioalkalivibrio nitratireducens DSM 14787]
MNAARVWGVALLVLVLAACGFQLRGAPDWPDGLDPIRIEGLAARDPLYQQLARSLRAAGVEVLPAGTPESAELRVLALREERRVLSVTGAARISEYELARQLDAELAIPGEPERLPLGRLEVSRIYVFDAASVLSQAEREEELRRAMDRDLVRLLQLRVQAVLAQRREALPR